MKDFSKLPGLLSVTMAGGAVLCLVGCSAVTRVPPGQSIAFAKAPKAEFVAEPPVALATAVEPVDEPYYGPAVEPELPVADFTLPSELEDVDVAATYAMEGNDYLAAGRNTEAVKVLTKAVKLEPSFSGAWRDLSQAYEALGQEENAAEAHRNYTLHSGQ